MVHLLSMHLSTWHKGLTKYTSMPYTQGYNTTLQDGDDIDTNA